MELEDLAEGGTLDIGGKKKRQAARIAADMYLNSPEVQEDRYREMLQEELKHVFLKFMEVSSQGRGFTSLVFGMGQLSDEGVIKKIAEQDQATIALQTPHMFHIWTGNFTFYNEQHFQRSGRNIRTESIF